MQNVWDAKGCLCSDKFQAGKENLCQANIAALSLVGNTFAKLLCTVHLEIDDKMETLHKNYTTIHYFRVGTIEVQLCNLYGDGLLQWGICYHPPFSKSWQRNVAEKMRKGDSTVQIVSQKMKWSCLDYEAMIGLRKKKRQKKRPSGGALLLTKALLRSIMLVKLLGTDNKNAQQKRAVAAMLTKSNLNGMDWLWRKFFNSEYPLPQKQIKQLIRDKKLIDSFFDSRIPLDTRRRTVAQEGGFLGFLLPLITKDTVPLVGLVAHKLFG